MALLLALESSTDRGSVALGETTGVLAEVGLAPTRKQSESLLPAVDFVLSVAGLSVRMLEGVVVAGGPGSFTGVRLAAATAKGLAHALEIPLYAFSGLQALAASAGVEERPVCAMFDARRSEVYRACYRFPRYLSSETLLEPAATSVEAVLEEVDVARVLFVGDGASRHAERIAAAGGMVLPDPLGASPAAALLWLAHLTPASGRVSDAKDWEPSYLRASGAERERAR